MVEPEEVKGPCVSRRKTAVPTIYVVQVGVLFDCQLSEKAREDSDHTVVIAVLYRHLPSWRNCERCNNFFCLPFGIPFARFDSL